MRHPLRLVYTCLWFVWQGLA